MELVLTNRTISSEPEPRNYEFAIEHLSNSNYKKIVDENYRTNSTKSVFGTRQILKYNRFNVINHIDVLLKLSVFAVVLAILF